MQLLIFCWIMLTAVPYARSLNVCTIISNSDCSCTNSTASSPQPVITCAFKTRPSAPLFSNQSESITLGTVDLSNNDLHDLPEDFFRGRGNVTVSQLVLNKSNLTTIPKAVASLALLGSLDISDNQLSSLSVDLLAGVVGLKKLDVSGNMLASPFAVADLGADASAKKLILEVLDLSRNGISSIGGNQLSALRKLTTLDLSHNNLTEITSQMFSPLKMSLVTLSLSHNNVSRIESQALEQLGHLRTLDLAYNKALTDLEDVRFPKHLRSLNLSHCALRIINHCRLSNLADLSFIGLSGNHLQCTCPLYLLLQWYQSQHHAGNSQDASSQGSDWACTTNYSSALAKHDNSSSTDPSIRKVADLQYCKDEDNHCNTMEHSDHHTKGSSQMVLTLNVAATSDTVMASWSLQENGEVAVDGFRLRYVPEDGEQMISDVIPADQRNFVMEPPELEIHFMVCLDVLAYQTAVVKQQCLSYKDESGNIVVGILAGVVFLVPCVTAMMYVFYKDHVIKKEIRYEEVAKEDVEKQAEASMSEDKCLFHLDPSKLKSDVSASNDPPTPLGPNTPVSSTTSSIAGDDINHVPHNIPHIVISPEDVQLTQSPQVSVDSVPKKQEGPNGYTMIEGTPLSSSSHAHPKTPAQPPKQQGVDNVSYISNEEGRDKPYESTYF